MSKKLVTTNAFNLQETTIGNYFRYEINGFQIVFGTSQITAGWEKEVYIPFSFSKAPVVVVTSNNGATVSVTNTYNNNFYCYASGDCYIHWIAVGKH